MRIVSLHKDFYDYLQYQYGQDLNIHWERDFLIPCPEDKISTTDSNLYSGSFDVISFQNQSYIVIPDKRLYGISDLLHSQFRYRDTRFYTKKLYYSFSYSPNPKYYLFFAYISVLGVIYPVVRVMDRNNKSIAFKYFDYDTFTSLPSGFQKEFKEFNRDISEKEFNSYINSIREHHKDILLEYHRRYRSPIFLYSFRPCPVVDYRNIIYIRREYSVLSEFPGLVNTIGSPEDLYQKIYNFFIELKNNEDILPPVELNNKEKILKAGFDLKQSFRHRK